MWDQVKTTILAEATRENTRKRGGERGRETTSHPLTKKKSAASWQSGGIFFGLYFWVVFVLELPAYPRIE